MLYIANRTAMIDDCNNSEESSLKITWNQVVKSGISVGYLSSSRRTQSLQSRITKDNFLNSRFTENKIKKSRIMTISPGTTLYLVKKTHERDQRGNTVYTNPGTTNDGNGMTVLNIFFQAKKQEMKSFHFRNFIRVILSFFFMFMFTITVLSVRCCFIPKSYFFHHKSGKNCLKRLITSLWRKRTLSLFLLKTSSCIRPCIAWLDEQDKVKRIIDQFVNDVHSGLRQNSNWKKNWHFLREMPYYPYETGMLGNMVVVILHFGLGACNSHDKPMQRQFYRTVYIWIFFPAKYGNSSLHEHALVGIKQCGLACTCQHC